MLIIVYGVMPNGYRFWRRNGMNSIQSSNEGFVVGMIKVL